MPATIEALAPRTQEAILVHVDELLDSAREGRENLHKTYVEIGIALADARKSQAWKIRHESWDEYLKTCGLRFDKGRTALYAYAATAERLLPEVSKETLIDMGITKAQSLAGFVKKSGKKPTPELLEAASNPKIGIDEFRASVAEELHEKPEKGIWYEFLGGFYVTAEEKAEFERVLELARNEVNLPAECSEWMERKIIAQAMTAECITSWEADAYIRKTDASESSVD